MRKSFFSILLAVSVFLFGFEVSAAQRGVVTCNLLNVRVTPGTNSGIIRQIPFGTQFDILSTENGWHSIMLSDSVQGFVSSSYVASYSETETVANEIAGKIASKAHNYLGYRYVYGTAGPSTFDCSGFTSYIYKQFGYSLPRSSYDQGNYGTYISKDDLAVGDLLFFSNRRDRRINHVGIYVGEGNFIHASTSGRGVVKDNLNENYYVNHYVSARRVL